MCVAFAVCDVREEHLQHLAGLGECAVAGRPHAEMVAVEVVVVDFDAVHPSGGWSIESRSPVCGDALGEFVDQTLLVAAIDVEDDEFGMAEVLDEPDRVAECKVVVPDLDDDPAVDLDLQVERLHCCFVGVTITLETHVGIVNEGSDIVPGPLLPQRAGGGEQQQLDRRLNRCIECARFCVIKYVSELAHA